MTIYAYSSWPTNAHLIRDVARLGYLQKNWLTLDPTYGRGVWWKLWRPDEGLLITHDKALDGYDFRGLPYPDKAFDVVAFDPPYKLNGTPTPMVDARYGVDIPARWQDRMQLCVDGITECARLTSRYLLVKCQDQVVSGKVRWQTFEFTEHAERQGLELVDRLDRLGSRWQDPKRRQVHARRNSSSLLVFER